MEFECKMDILSIIYKLLVKLTCGKTYIHCSINFDNCSFSSNTRFISFSSIQFHSTSQNQLNRPSQELYSGIGVARTVVPGCRPKMGFPRATLHKLTRSWEPPSKRDSIDQFIWWSVVRHGMISSSWAVNIGYTVWWLGQPYRILHSPNGPNSFVDLMKSFSDGALGRNFRRQPWANLISSLRFLSISHFLLE